MKQRADVLLHRQGLADSREKARVLIMAGRVYMDEVRVEKPAQLLPEEQVLTLRGETDPFVSRGAQKIEKALAEFDVPVQGVVAMDIGAAAGGFTDALLRRGAAHVYAIDVGYGQMDWRLRQDARVTVMERTNARYITADQFPLHPTLTVMDVSFISIKLILPVVCGIMGEKGRVVTLIKPQFEAGREHVGKHGVVRDSAVHERLLTDIRDFAQSMGWGVRRMTWSPVTGPKGNIEFLAELLPGRGTVTDEVIHQLVTEAHRVLS